MSAYIPLSQAMNKKHLPHAFLFAAIITTVLYMVLSHGTHTDFTHWKAIYWLSLDNSQVFARFAILYYITMNFSSWRSPNQISLGFTATMALLFMALYFTARSVVSLLVAIPFFLSSPAHSEIYSWWSNYSRLIMVICTQWLIPLLLLTLIIRFANYRQELKEDTFVENTLQSDAKTFWIATIILAVVFFSGFVNVILSHTNSLKELIFYTNGLFNQHIMGQADVFHGYTIFSCTSIIALIIASFFGLKKCSTHYFDAAPALYKIFICAAALMSLWLAVLIMVSKILQSNMLLPMGSSQPPFAYFQFFIVLWLISALVIYGACRLLTAVLNTQQTYCTKKTLK